MEAQYNYTKSLIAGGVAGLLVDISLFPLDTLKTRLQSAQGFFKTGGFYGVYKGIGPQVIGSAPTAALFFYTYDAFKAFTIPFTPKEYFPFVYVAGASISEVVACLIRVPVEVVKQRKQTILGNRISSMHIFINAYKSEGVINGLYRGFGSTIFREIPFSAIQFPVWEFLKTFWSSNFKDNEALQPWEVALCGAVAGGFSAAITTPLDVVKTRIMLADKNLANKNSLHIITMFKSIYHERGLKGLFAGLIPRTMWITLGGAIFFGAYDLTKTICNLYL